MKVRDQFSQTKIWRLISHHESVSKNLVSLSSQFGLGQLHSKAFVKHMLSSYVARLALFKMHVGRKSHQQTQCFLTNKSNETIFDDPQSLIPPTFSSLIVWGPNSLIFDFGYPPQNLMFLQFDTPLPPAYYFVTAYH